MLTLMIATPIIFLLPRPEIRGEDLPLMMFENLLSNSTSAYFLYPQNMGSLDYQSAKNISNALTNHSLTELYYQPGDPFVDSDGCPKPEAIPPGECIILVGGPSTQACVKYYEVTKQAPLIVKLRGGNVWWETRNGEIADETLTALANLDSHHDIFIVEFFKDRHHRNILICYGLNWQGTLLAGQYFSQVVYPKISDYEEPYYILKWVDSNNDASPTIDEVVEIL